jgi:hypothetical protein
MVSETKPEWQTSKAVIDGVLGKCVNMWLQLDKLEDSGKRLENVQQIRVGLAIANRYLRILRMDEDVRQAQANKLLIEQSQAQIKELERKINAGGKDEGKEGS